MDIFIDVLKPIFYAIIIVLCIAGVELFINIGDFAQKIQYYENNIKIDAIEYHNEIYLKKGE